MAQALGGLVTGKDVFTRIYVAKTPGGNATQWRVLARSIRVQEQAVLVADGVCGELRDRLMKIPNFYSVDVDCYDDGASSSLLDNWLNSQANDDAYQPQLSLASGLVFRYLDGSSGSFAFKNCNLGPLDYQVGGRTERAQARVSFRAQFFNRTGSAV